MNDNKTVIIISINAAWAAPNSMFDLFLESLRKGNHTEGLTKHVLVVAMDPKAYRRCLAIHPHCYDLSPKDKDLSGEGFFMTQGYLDIIWRRVEFLIAVLEHGYNFIFSVYPLPRALSLPQYHFNLSTYFILFANRTRP